MSRESERGEEGARLARERPIGAGLKNVRLRLFEYGRGPLREWRITTNILGREYYLRLPPVRQEGGVYRFGMHYFDRKSIRRILRMVDGLAGALKAAVDVAGRVLQEVFPEHNIRPHTLVFFDGLAVSASKFRDLLYIYLTPFYDARREADGRLRLKLGLTHWISPAGRISGEDMRLIEVVREQLGRIFRRSVPLSEATPGGSFRGTGPV